MIFFNSLTGDAPFLRYSKSLDLMSIRLDDETFEKCSEYVMSNILVSPILFERYPKMNNRLKQVKEEFEDVCIFVDSGSFKVQTGELTYEYVLKKSYELYQKFEKEIGGDIYVAPDWPLTGHESEEYQRKIVQKTVSEVIKFYNRCSDDFKEKLIAPIHGFTYEQIDYCISEYLANCDFNYFAFGSLPTKQNSSGSFSVMYLDIETLQRIVYILRKLKENGKDYLHVFGIGNQPAMYVLSSLGVSSVDSTSLSRITNRPNIVLPFTFGFRPSIQQELSQTFYELRDIWSHRCCFCNNMEELVLDGWCRYSHNAICFSQTLERSQLISVDEIIELYNRSIDLLQQKIQDKSVDERKMFRSTFMTFYQWRIPKIILEYKRFLEMDKEVV